VDNAFPASASAEEAPDVSVTARLREAAIESGVAEMQDATDKTDAEQGEETHLAALSAPRLKPAAPPEEAAADDPGPDDPDHEAAPALDQAALAELASAVEAAHTNEEESHRGGFFSDCSGCPDMATLDGGAFLMGAPRGEEGRQPAEGPQRRINIGYRFAIATRETTFDQWALCVDDGGCRDYAPPDEGWGRADRPVINVSYEDASAYARWLSAKTGSYYRLPSEAEWEFAARAGGEKAMSSGAAPGEMGPSPASRDNAFGLFGMLGNVREWTLDCWAPSHHGGPATGAARIDGDCSRRVVKGGAGNAPGSASRPAARRPADVERRAPDTGFRVVRVLD
jgi:formylglycine-generating enzyme required for sulfatase activity